MAAIPPICDFGWKAVDAVLPGVDGNTHSIFQQAQANGLVVVFICNHCPYVVGVIDRIVATSNVLRDLEIGFVAINSNDPINYPQDSFKNMIKFAEHHSFSFPYLFDESQEVAKFYDAVCTPDFFGFNSAFELQYRGRLDASKNQQISPDLRNDLVEAMTLVIDTGKGPSHQVASMGCSIKWREG